HDDRRVIHHVLDLVEHLQGDLVRVADLGGGKTHDARPAGAVHHQEVCAAKLGRLGNDAGATTSPNDGAAGLDAGVETIQDLSAGEGVLQGHTRYSFGRPVRTAYWRVGGSR